MADCSYQEESLREHSDRGFESRRNLPLLEHQIDSKKKCCNAHNEPV